MNLLDPWSLVFFVGFVVFLYTRHVFQKATIGETKVVSKADGTERILLLLVMITCMLLPMLYLLTPWLAVADYEAPPPVPVIGCVVLLLSLWLFWRSHADLGKNWSVTLELREGHELVRSGVYSRIRHPMYTSIWLWSIAQAMLLPNWLAGFGCLAAFAAMYVIRTPKEERMMHDNFGELYEEYCRQTGRILPKWGSHSSPDRES